MSLDKTNFALQVKEQQGGIAPQFWPILCPDNGNLVLNQPYEICINPCDAIWLPITYDKSYGPNAWQTSKTQPSQWMMDPSIAGQNICDVIDYSGNEAFAAIPAVIQAPVFGLRFNSPNNPWTLWSLAQTVNNWQPWGAGAGMGPFGSTTFMRSITGPISRLWIQYYFFAAHPGLAEPPSEIGGNQIVLISSLGYSTTNIESQYNVMDAHKLLTTPPPALQRTIAAGGYITPQMNTADLHAIGNKAAKAAV